MKLGLNGRLVVQKTIKKKHSKGKVTEREINETNKIKLRNQAHKQRNRAQIKFHLIANEVKTQKKKKEKIIKIYFHLIRGLCTKSVKKIIYFLLLFLLFFFK